MEEDYGIFTTDGQRLSGELYDESITGLAEKLDESTASLFIKTSGTVVYLGTAINVQKKGRRPDTFIYLEKTAWHGSLPPRIDLSYINDFYSRVAERLSSLDYSIRDMASDSSFMGDRRGRVVSGLFGPDIVEYALGRTLLCKEVVCISADLAKSVDFVVAITEKLAPYLYAGFTIVVSKRHFRGADILVTEKAASEPDIGLDNETIRDLKWADVYRTAGMLPQRPGMTHWASGRRSRGEIAEKLLENLRQYMRDSGNRESYIRSFTDAEEIGKFPCGTTAGVQYPATGDSYSRAPPVAASPSENDYRKWEVTEYERIRLNEDYESLMEKKRKSRLKMVVGLVIILILAAAAILVSGPAGPLFHVTPTPEATPYITPSATIAPAAGEITIERLGASPGNTPDGLKGASSAYNISLSSPQNVLIELSEDYDPMLPYYLMRFNITSYSWDYVQGTSEYTTEGADVEIPEKGIYRIFTARESMKSNATGGP